MPDPVPPADASESLLASLNELGARVESAKADRPRPGGRGRWWIAALVVVVLALVGGSVALVAAGGDDDGAELSAAQAPEAPTTAPTTAPTAAPTTATTTAPTTVATPTTAAVTSSTAPAPDPGPAPVPEPAPVPAASDGTRTVVAGDSFWTIAEAVAGPDASLEVVTQVWAGIVDANADRLVEPGNPDLILPGQVLVLPAGGGSP